MSFLGKEYYCHKQENFEEFLKFVGVPDEKVKEYSLFNPTMMLVQNGDSYTFHTQTPEGPSVTTFKSGVEFDDVTGPMKYPIKNLFVVDGDTLTQTITFNNGQVVFKREYHGDEMTLTITAKGWDGVSKRFYKIK